MAGGAVVTKGPLAVIGVVPITPGSSKAQKLKIPDARDLLKVIQGLIAPTRT